MKKHIFQNLSWGIYISLMLSSCSNDSNEVITPAEEDVYLKVVTSMGETRNVITSSTFSSGDAIGLFLRNSGGGNNGSNIKATYSSNQWSLAEKIRVGYYEESTPLTVYAYYPYKSGIGQHGIPLTLISVMWKVVDNLITFMGVVQTSIRIILQRTSTSSMPWLD